MRAATKALCLLLLGQSTLAGRVIDLASTNYPPYFSEFLPNDGVVAAITKEAFANRGYTVKLHYRPWARLMAEVQSGLYDGVMAVWFSQERAQYLRFSDPVANTLIGFYIRNDKPLPVGSLAALKPYVIGTVRGYKNPDNFDTAGLRIEPADDDITNLRKLAAGRLDLILIDKALARSLLPELPPEAASKIHWQDPPVKVMPLHVGFAKSKSGSALLSDEFNKGLAAIRKNGKLRQIEQQYQFMQ
jgi:polar amino acid transport system substrate-binding protein